VLDPDNDLITLYERADDPIAAWARAPDRAVIA
jgi:hypothetical protein